MAIGVFPKCQHFVDKLSFNSLESDSCNINVTRSKAMSKKLPDKATLPAERPPIVSSAHLVSPKSAEMSEFEFGLIVAGNAFHRWIVHCMSAAGLKDLTP